MTLTKNLLPNSKIIALAGNPNVGKSTVFNYLTGMNQHTGNWPGKTVSSARGGYTFNGNSFTLVDIPGTYSLLAHSSEEEVARNFMCFGNPDGVVVVCDATCLERNLNLVLQIIEITPKVVVCVNLMDEAERKQIRIDFDRLSNLLGVEVVSANATKGTGLMELQKAIASMDKRSHIPPLVQYAQGVEEAVSLLEPAIRPLLKEQLNARWLALRLLENNLSFTKDLEAYMGYDISTADYIAEAMEKSRQCLQNHGIANLEDVVVSCIIGKAEEICRKTVSFQKADYNARDRKIDKILTSKLTGIPVMLLLLAVIFWLTISGSNYPSRLLSQGFFWIQDRLLLLAGGAGMPAWLSNLLILGIYRVVAWVVSVMLPPMAIFFPLFTLLEDLGYLPRIAFNLDHQFKKCSACGKQALTMWIIAPRMP